MLFTSLLQAAKLLCRPYGLKEHQLRPQDVGERTLMDLERERAGEGGVRYANSGNDGQVNLGYTGPPAGEFTKF